MEMNGVLNQREAADFLGMSEAFWERDRWAGPRIPFIKVGTRAVRYRRKDLEKFLDGQTVRSAEASGR